MWKTIADSLACTLQKRAQDQDFVNPKGEADQDSTCNELLLKRASLSLKAADGCPGWLLASQSTAVGSGVAAITHSPPARFSQRYTCTPHIVAAGML